MTTARNYSALDQFLNQLDWGVRTVFGRPTATERLNPAVMLSEVLLSDEERQRSARLMRVNHAGEVAAQALYQGQSLTARMPRVRSQMERAAQEENDHLAWCEDRLHELGGQTSLLNPLWYLGSLSIGALAGWAGDQWSLGFLAETERQVVAHLDNHLKWRLPEGDQKSRAILTQMREDEAQHATTALRAGGGVLPEPIKRLMDLASSVMTQASYWL
jgi:ubiquinone biosynthesis monooxygenase Coq7